MQHRDDERDVASRDGERITGHLGFAINEFREMKMQLSMERALEHKGIPEAWLPATGNNQP